MLTLSPPQTGNSHSHTLQPNERTRFAPEMSRPTTNLATNTTLQDHWNQVLRARRGAEAPLLKCPYCYDRPVFTEENDLWVHVKKTHAVHIPKDNSLVKRFRDDVLAKSRAVSKYVRLVLQIL
jgi:uncharacterized C2H2 Zn-finger protein